MTADAVLTTDDVHHLAARHTAPGHPAGVGIETEWFVVDRTHPMTGVPPERTAAALTGTDLTGGSLVTYEPGGQLELSGPPAPLPRALDAMEADLAAATAALQADALAPVGLGADPARPPRRLLKAPRYEAMAQHFGDGPGRLMMASTAALQVNLRGGDRTRWRLAHALGPALIAAFAASPLLNGRVTGWRSSRQAVWLTMDASRTGSVEPLADAPAEAWARYLLDARVMLVNTPGGGCLPVKNGSTLADWIAGRGPVRRRPTVEDLEYHATTLFPPVRPRGWLELRYIDAQPTDSWPVAVAVTTALLDDPRAADAAADACAPVAGRWMDAARVGPADRDLRAAATDCLRIALEALPRLGAGAALVDQVGRWADRYTAAGRCPADDLLAQAARRGPLALLTDPAGRDRQAPAAAAASARDRAEATR